MLVLTRKKNEKVIIDIGKENKIEVTILAIYKDKISLGIKAPRHCPIYRQELITEENGNSRDWIVEEDNALDVQSFQIDIPFAENATAENSSS